MRVPAFLTLSAFLANSAAGAQSLPHTHAIQAPGAYGLSRSPESLKVPPRWGMLEKFHPQPQKPLAILIQDAHAVLPAQENIENLILHAVRAYGAGFAALEGGSGALDVLIWKKFPDQQRLEESLKKYFEQSELTGGQIAAVTEKNVSPFTASKTGKPTSSIRGSTYARWISGILRSKGLKSIAGSLMPRDV